MIEPGVLGWVCAVVGGLCIAIDLELRWQKVTSSLIGVALLIFGTVLLLKGFDQ